MILGFGRKPADRPAPPLAVVVAWRNRPEIERTLAHNAGFLPAGTETIVVNCGGDPAGLRDAVASSGAPGIRRLDLPHAPFVKCLALNLGVHAARADRIFLLDADVMIDEPFVDEAIAEIEDGSVVTVERVFEESPDVLEETPHIVEIAMSLSLVDATGARAVIDINRARFDEMSRSAPGLALFARERFLAVGGMNSELTGWGWEDLDLVVRFQLALGLRHRLMGRVVHMTHGDDKRAIPPGSSRGQSENENFTRCMTNYQNARYLGTLEADVARWGAALVENA